MTALISFAQAGADGGEEGGEGREKKPDTRQAMRRKSPKIQKNTHAEMPAERTPRAEVA